MNTLTRLFNTTKHHIHFIGIGGIGMSGIAEVLHNLGYHVKGSDASQTSITKRLESLGVEVFPSHQPSHVEGALVVVISSAIKKDNPELLAAKTLGIPVLQRAEMLAELMRFKQSVAISGTHGKTTTTSLMAALFEAADLDPTVVNGGILNAHNSNARLGAGDWIVVEADESDGSFVKLHPTLTVVTNIDPEHMEYYQTFDNLKKAFLQFIHNMPFYGVAAMCVDHDVVKELCTTLTDRRFVTYGFSQQAMVRAVNLRSCPKGTTFDVEISDTFKPLLTGNGSKTLEDTTIALPYRVKDIYLPMMGKHNVQNALSLIVIAKELGISEDVVKKALSSFKGVRRRFTCVGESHGVTVIDDYAHHPVEIQTVIKAARQACPQGRLITVMQPHRYTRLQSLFADFSNAFCGSDTIVIAPVYSAGEDEIEGVNSGTLAAAIRTQHDIPVHTIASSEELPLLLRRIVKAGDLVLMMGAGSITYWAATLPVQLDQLGLVEADTEGKDKQTAPRTKMVGNNK